jgi:hypothetical protein
MVLNATVITISAMSWRSALLAEEHVVPGVNQRPVAGHCQIYHKTYNFILL